MEIVTAIARNSGFIFSLVGPQFGYLTSYKRNLDKLRTQLRKLTDDRIDMQRTVEDARKQGEDIAVAVQGWLDRVEATIAGANKLINEDNDGHGEVRCLNWPFPNLCIRFKLSMEAKEMAQKISEIIDDGKPFKRVSFPVPPQTTTSSSARGYEALESRTSTLNKIKQALKDPEIYMIGVYGMGGVGKTTLMKELAWQVKKEGSFSVVVMATITNTPNLRRIQGQLADGLDLNLGKETEEGRAGELRGRISQEKSILVILDDIWGELDLIELGVPHGDDHKGCKLVLTSRDRNVLSSKMDTQKNFSLETLFEVESWNLFQRIAGNVVEHHSIKPIAVQVAKCCVGLPLLIVIVAKAMRKKEDVMAWEDSLKRLQRFDHEDSLTDKVHRSLKLSYDYLESEELKSLFLLIGCFEPDDVLVQDLLPICWGLGLYKHVGTLAEARNRHYTLINDLRASSLLLAHKFQWLPNWVRMHDLVHEVAKSIASTTHPTNAVQRFTEIKDRQKIDQLPNCHYIILPPNISGLPEMVDCPDLKLLVLQHKFYLTVPDNFFSGMRKVTVLHFDGMMFTKSPPPSLHLLANLRSLNLSRSYVEDIAIVGELTRLEILILKGIENIVELPKEILHLICLRMLNVSNCPSLRLIPKNLLSSLKCLEELYMENCPIEWEVEGSNNHNNDAKASLGELRNWHQLTTSKLMPENRLVFQKNLHNFPMLERYNLSIGKRFAGVLKLSRRLELRDSSHSNVLFNDVVQLLLPTVESLYLGELECVRNIFPELNGDGFMKLRYLHIENSIELLHIINSSSERHDLNHAFPDLETLVLSSLKNMEEICHGPLPAQSFDMLKVIEVNSCNKLKHLLLCSHIRHLSQLHEMKISECQSMTEIIAEDIQEEIHEIDVFVLPKLHSLSLKCLPMLLSFCSVPFTFNTGPFPLALIDEKVASPSLGTVELSGINMCKVILPNMNTLLISNLENLKSLCHIQQAPDSFSNLSKIEISKCPKLLNVFPPYLLNNLHNLETLDVSECDELRVIFEIPEPSTIATNEQGLSTRLRALTLDLLPKLKYIWSKDPHGILRFQKLCTVQVHECRSLDHVFPISVAEDLQQLENLRMYNCGIENIVEKGDSEGIKRVYLENLWLSRCHRLKNIVPYCLVFQNLNELHVRKCNEVVNIMTLSMATSLSELRVLKISFCDNIEEIVASENDGGAPIEIAFMKLELLELECLCRLKSFCGGNYSFMFPSLQTVRIFQCLMMETFCNGNLTAPSLTMVTTFREPSSEEEHRWDGDLNTTIGNIFAEKNLCILIQLLLQERVESNCVDSSKLLLN